MTPEDGPSIGPSAREVARWGLRAVRVGEAGHPGPARWEDAVCRACGVVGDEASLLLCDGLYCNVAIHMECLDRPLVALSAGPWHCPTCEAGILELFGEEMSAATPAGGVAADVETVGAARSEAYPVAEAGRIGAGTLPDLLEEPSQLGKRSTHTKGRLT